MQYRCKSTAFDRALLSYFLHKQFRHYYKENISRFKCLFYPTICVILREAISSKSTYLQMISLCCKFIISLYAEFISEFSLCWTLAPFIFRFQICFDPVLNFTIDFNDCSWLHRTWSSIFCFLVGFHRKGDAIYLLKTWFKKARIFF